ncbi:hypothetical protein LOAG_04086 [Loa loa]|nr:hypothetical protein LOAG_04086 [Loa loa]EFO24401.1 hypothetical protein LOAG_04086 [Loa loa]
MLEHSNRCSIQCEGMVRFKKLEEANRELITKSAGDARCIRRNKCINSLGKARQRLIHGLEGTQVDTIRAKSFANSLGKK